MSDDRAIELGVACLTMTIKNSAGKVVWKSVFDFTTGKTTYPVGGDGYPSLPGGSEVTLSGHFDAPMSRGDKVSIDEEIESGGVRVGYETRCETSTAGESGCSAKLTLRQPDMYDRDQTFNFNASVSSPGTTYAGTGLSCHITLLEPES